MNGFSFPPPPPPPPRTAQVTADHQGFQYEAQTRGRGRGRGGNSRARYSQPRGGQDQGAGHFASYGQARDSYSNSITNGSNQPNLQHSQNGQSSHANTHFHGLPAGAFVNPKFLPQQAAPQHAGFFSKEAPPVQYGRNYVQPTDDHRSPLRDIAGHKRKLEALRGPVRERKPAPPTAPGVPSFGTPVSSLRPTSRDNTSSAQVTNPKNAGTRKKSLGLTPAHEDVQYSSSDGEDEEREVDEEAMYAELGDKLTFEHNGVVMSLKSTADLAVWKKERQKNWPTRTRTTEKDEQRRRTGGERKRLLAGALRLQGLAHQQRIKSKDRKMPVRAETGSDATRKAHHVESEIVKPETESEKTRKKLTAQTKQLEELRRKVAESEAKNRKAHEYNDQEHAVSTSPTKIKPEPHETDDSLLAPIDTVVEVANTDQDDLSDSEDSSPIESSSVVSSSLSSEDADSDHEAPEETTSKPAAAVVNSTGIPACRYFTASGYCRDGDACRFKHERPSRTAGGGQRDASTAQKASTPNPTVQQRQHKVTRERKSIYQRLVEQEREEEDRLALKAVKYLGAVGFFKEAGQYA